MPLPFPWQATQSKASNGKAVDESTRCHKGTIRSKAIDLLWFREEQTKPSLLSWDDSFESDRSSLAPRGEGLWCGVGSREGTLVHRWQRIPGGARGRRSTSITAVRKTPSGTTRCSQCLWTSRARSEASRPDTDSRAAYRGEQHGGRGTCDCCECSLRLREDQMAMPWDGRRSICPHRVQPRALAWPVPARLGVGPVRPCVGGARAGLGVTAGDRGSGAQPTQKSATKAGAGSCAAGATGTGGVGPGLWVGLRGVGFVKEGYEGSGSGPA